MGDCVAESAAYISLLSMADFNFSHIAEVKVTLRSKKARRFEIMLHFDSSLPSVIRVSHAPPHHALPAFLNLNRIS